MYLTFFFLLILLKATNAMLYPEDKFDAPLKLTKPGPKPTVEGNAHPTEGSSSFSSNNKFNFHQTGGASSNNGQNSNSCNSQLLRNTSNGMAPHQFGTPNSPPMDGLNGNLKGQSGLNRKPGLLNDPSRKDAPRNPWNCNTNSGAWNNDPGPGAWNNNTGRGLNNRSNDSGGQFGRGKGQQGNFSSQRGNFGDQQGNYEGPNNFGGQSKGYAGSNQQSRDYGASNQRKGLFSSVRQNNEVNVIS